MAGYKVTSWPVYANPDDKNYVDVLSRMYPDLSQLVGMAESGHIDRPIIMCEYLHAMGNSIGGLSDFWKEIRDYPNLIGGYIWDMIDQGLAKEGPDGKQFYAYGGDFGDQPNDENFCMNGVFASDRTPNPHAWECKHIFQPAVFESAGKENSVRVINRFSFTNLNQYQLQWILKEDGKELQKGTIQNVNVSAGSSAIIDLPLKPDQKEKNKEYWLDISMHESIDRLWCKKGFEVAKSQILLQEATPTEHVSLKNNALSKEESSKAIVVNGKSFSIKLDKESGELISYTYKDAEVLETPLTLNLWRAPIDNDVRGANTGAFEKSASFWKKTLDQLTVSSIETTQDDQLVTISVEKKADNKVAVSYRYTIFSDGNVAVDVTMQADKSLPDLIRFGVTMGIADRFKDVVYYGLGPHENYVDRKSGAFVDEYGFKTNELFYNYAMPQDNGNREEVRWVEFYSNSKEKLRISGAPVFGFSAWPYSQNSIAEAKHPYDLKAQGFYTVNIDQFQMGVTGTLSHRLPQYIYPSGNYKFKFNIQVSKN